MKLFEFHAEPDENNEGPEFSLKPTEELESQLSDGWLEQMTDEVATCVASIIANKEKRAEFENGISFAKLQATLNEELTVGIEFTPMLFLQQMMEDLPDDKVKKLNSITEVYSDKLAALITEYMETVFSSVYP